MTTAEAARLVEVHGRMTKLPAGSWRAQYGAIAGYGATRPAAILDAAHHLAQRETASDPWRGTYGGDERPIFQPHHEQKARPSMGRTPKFDIDSVMGALVVAAIVGGVLGSWSTFAIAAVVLTAAACCAGHVRRY